jgi:sterol desaturase/sphingolipid hydroxylase (fatty acid hydroxylase superfamily)
VLNAPRFLRVGVVVAVHVVALGLLARAWSQGPAWVALAGAMAGYLMVDLATLFVHWTLDNWFTPATPLIGGVVFYFRQHHVQPMAMFQRDFVDNNFENALLGLVAEVPLALAGAGAFGSALAGCMALSAAWITTIHKAAHLERPSRAARMLQRMRVLVDKRYHDVHHAGSGTHYGLVCGWCEPLVCRLRVFELMEFVIVRLTGQIPVHPRLQTTVARARRLRAWAP